MENITRTIKKTSYTCVVFDRTTKTMNESKFTLDKAFDNDTALKILAKKFNGDTLTIADVLGSESIEQLYSMPVETFLKYAKPIEKQNPALITRTIKKTSYTCVVFDRTTKTMNESKFTLDKAFDNDTALKILAKKFNGDTLTIADVLGSESIEQLYGIEPEIFMNHAAPIYKDSKEG